MAPPFLTEGDSALNFATSAVLRETLTRGDGVIESQVLPHSYRHLSPLGSLVRARVKGVEEGALALGGPQPSPAEQAASFAARNRGSRSKPYCQMGISWGSKGEFVMQTFSTPASSRQRVT